MHRLVTITCCFSLLWLSVESVKLFNNSWPSINEFFDKELLRGYNRKYRPSKFPDQGESGSTYVKISIEVLNIYGISVKDMHFSVGIFFRQVWRDPRLAYSGYNRSVKVPTLSDVIWKPDLSFRNGKKGLRHKLTGPNIYLELTPDGNVTLSQKFDLLLHCPMNLVRFPFDTQCCAIELESYALDTQELQLTWDMDTVVNFERDNILIPGFVTPHVKNVKVENCTRTYKLTGNYSCLKLRFPLKRLYSHHIVVNIAPSAVIVVLSWTSFYMEPRASPSRTSIGLLTILAVVTQIAYAPMYTPAVSYVTALETWLFACMGFLTAALLEFTLVHKLSETTCSSSSKEDTTTIEETALTPLQQARWDSVSLNHNHHAQHKSVADATPTQRDDDRKEKKRYTLRRRLNQMRCGCSCSDCESKWKWSTTLTSARVDKWARVIFPMAFIGFIFIYWWLYFTHLNDEMCDTSIHL